MVGWHHRLKEHESEQALGDGEGQGSLVCPWGHSASVQGTRGLQCPGDGEERLPREFRVSLIWTAGWWEAHETREFEAIPEIIPRTAPVLSTLLESHTAADH